MKAKTEAGVFKAQNAMAYCSSGLGGRCSVGALVRRCEFVMNTDIYGYGLVSFPDPECETEIEKWWCRACSM
jgi:hypothetical protein